MSGHITATVRILTRRLIGKIGHAGKDTGIILNTRATPLRHLRQNPATKKADGAGKLKSAGGISTNPTGADTKEEKRIRPLILFS